MVSQSVIDYYSSLQETLDTKKTKGNVSWLNEFKILGSMYKNELPWGN